MQIFYAVSDTEEIKHLQAYRPVASAAAGSALAAFIDLRDSGSGAAEAGDHHPDLSQGDKERQRKFLLQLQRTKWLAQHGKLANNSDKVTSSVRMKELSMASASSNSDKSELTHMERMRKDRNAYSSE